MNIKTISQLIDWTRKLHSQLGKCLTECASGHPDERSRMLLAYLGDNEGRIAGMVGGFEAQADLKALDTYVYDYMPHKPVDLDVATDGHYVELDYEEIRGEVFGYHEAVANLYRTLIDRAPIPEAVDVAQKLLTMETNETKLMVQQTARMEDL